LLGQQACASTRADVLEPEAPQPDILQPAAAKHQLLRRVQQ
jgi:hypothetical protein